MANIYQVINKVGENNVDHILNYMRGGKMNDQNITDFSELLGRPPHPDEPNILFGGHTKRMETNNTRPRDSQMRAILSDWWDEELFNDAMSSEEAVEKLARAFSHPDIGCKPLGNKLLPSTRQG
jgi:hypothetical protein